MELDSKIYTILIGVLLGSALGFLTQSYLARVSLRSKILESLVNRYLSARDEVCAIVASCTIGVNSSDSKWVRSKQDSLCLIYYKYYDYIPQEVIRELICLQACLADQENRLFEVRDNELCPVTQSQLPIFCDHIALLSNIAHALYYNLHNGTSESIRGNRIEYQARHVLVMVNRYFTEANLSSLHLVASKHSAYAARLSFDEFLNKFGGQEAQKRHKNEGRIL